MLLPQEALNKLLDSLSGASCALRIIITSRTRALRPLAPGVLITQLEALPLADAVQLLHTACPDRQLQQDEAEQVAEACGRNGLELCLVGAVLNTGQCDAQVRGQQRCLLE